MCLDLPKVESAASALIGGTRANIPKAHAKVQMRKTAVQSHPRSSLIRAKAHSITLCGHAFTLVELMIIILFLGIFAAVVVPKMNFSAVSKKKADTAASTIVTVLRRTRGLAISSAATNSSGFALNMTGSAPYKGYQIRDLDTAATVDSFTIDSTVECTGGREFRFGPLGNLLGGSDNTLTVTAAGKSFTITITSATGMIACAEN